MTEWTISPSLAPQKRVVNSVAWIERFLRNPENQRQMVPHVQIIKVGVFGFRSGFMTTPRQPLKGEGI